MSQPVKISIYLWVVLVVERLAVGMVVLMVLLQVAVEVVVLHRFKPSTRSCLLRVTLLAQAY